MYIQDIQDEKDTDAYVFMESITAVPGKEMAGSEDDAVIILCKTSVFCKIPCVGRNTHLVRKLIDFNSILSNKIHEINLIIF